MREHEAGNRVVLAARRQRDAELIGHLVGGHPTSQQPRSVVTWHRSRFFCISIRAECARNCFQDVSRRYHAFEVAIFIMDQSHRHLSVTQQLKCVKRIGSVWDDGRSLSMGPDVERLTRQEGRQQLLRLRHTNDLVRITFANGQARMDSGLPS